MIYLTINNLISDALKNKDQSKLNTLRLIKSELVTAEKNGIEITDSSELKILYKMIQQRKDSIEEYKKANRQDLIDKEQAEISIIKDYLPNVPSDDVIRKCAEDWWSFNRYTCGDKYTPSMKDMKFILEKVKQQYDYPNTGKIVSDVVKQHIQSYQQ